MEILSVIEFCGDTFLSIDSFPIMNDVEKESLVEKAEKLFIEKINENMVISISKEDEEYYINEGIFESSGGTYKILLTWSNVLK